MATILIVGAGLSGLSAAHRLQQTGHTVTVLDKGRGVGGRLATRRLDAGRADHGAQYVSAKSPDFRELITRWQQQGLVQEWHLEESDPASFHHPRFVARDGMASLAKQLAQNLSVRTGERVTQIEYAGAGWRVRCESGLVATADELLLTLPVPQALALLQTSGIQLPEAGRQALEQVHYEPCLAVMLRLNQPSRLPAPGGLKRTEGPVSWLADNQQKGVSPDVPTVTIHASHDYSQQHLDDADLTALIPELVTAVSDYIPADSIVDQQVHRWRYSNATQRHPEPCLVVDLPGTRRLFFGGDGFGSGNVEGAFLSGLALATSVQ